MMMNRHRMEVRSLLIRIIAFHSPALRQNRRFRRAFSSLLSAGMRRKRAYLILVYYNPPPNSIARILPGISCADRPYTGYGHSFLLPSDSNSQKDRKKHRFPSGGRGACSCKSLCKTPAYASKKGSPSFPGSLPFPFQSYLLEKKYPTPHLVKINSGWAGFSSIFSRKRRI